MPVHDAMYTHSVASKLQKFVDPEKNKDLNEWIESVKKRAIAASTESAHAARTLFEILDYAKNCDDPYIRAEAEKILKSPYLAEIA